MEGHGGENVSISANVLKQYFLEKSQTERLFDVLSSKINTFVLVCPPSIVAPSNQLFVNQILSRKQLHYIIDNLQALVSVTKIHIFSHVLLE